MASLPNELRSTKALYAFLGVGPGERQFFREALGLQIHSSIDPEATGRHKDVAGAGASAQVLAAQDPQVAAAPRPATGRAAAVLGASASRPVAGTPTAGQTENRLNL